MKKIFDIFDLEFTVGIVPASTKKSKQVHFTDYYVGNSDRDLWCVTIYSDGRMNFGDYRLDRTFS